MSMQDEVENAPGRFAYEGLDRVLHEKHDWGL
jgi:hypothetical protein